MNTLPQDVCPAGIVTEAANLIALTIAIVLCTSAVNVTQSMMIRGGKSILLLRPVTFKNTQSVRITRALNNWLAEPNNGQIFAYPILVRMNPHTNVTIVEKYVLHNNFLHPSACSISSTLKSSWKLIRPIRATASSDVRARADTHIVMNTVAKCTGTPNISKNPATPLLKIANGVLAGSAPLVAAAPATQRASTPSKLSSTIAP